MALLNVLRIRVLQIVIAFIFTMFVMFALRVVNEYATSFTSKSDVAKIKKSAHHLHRATDLRNREVADDQLLNQHNTQPLPDESISGWTAYSQHDSVEETDHVTEIDVNLKQTIDNWRGVHPELYKMAPEVFDEVPTSFNSKNKSPCWSRNNTLWCLPYFYVAGMPKCGTSDVWDKLMKHPNIMRMRKEPHWWTRGRLGVHIANHPEGIVTFTNYVTRYQRYKDFKNAVQNTPEDDVTIVWGDGSASTLWDNRDWRPLGNATNNYTEPPYVVADIINTVQPEAKVIVIFRDPVTRLYSDYLYFHDEERKGKQLFHTLAELTIASFNECRAKHKLRYCVYNLDYMMLTTDRAVKVLDWKPKPLRLHLGMYNVYLRDWLRLKQLKHIHVLQLEDWHDNCETLLPELFQFLDLEKISEQGIREACGTETKNVNEVPKSRTTMFNKTRTLLSKFYQPFKEDLAKLLKDSRFLWNE